MQPKKTRSALWGKIILTLCVLILGVCAAFASSAKISTDLQGKNGTDQVDVIVQYNQVPTAEHHQKVFSRGGTLKRELGSFKGAAYSIPASALADLAGDPDVVYITPDRPLQAASSTPQAPVNDYHIATINAPAAWADGLYGTGIGVAVIDSGIGNVPDLSSGNIVYSEDFTGSGSAADQYGHGTHVSGIIAGNGRMSTGWRYSYTFMGIADNVNLVNLRVLDKNGASTVSEAIAAIQTAIQLQSQYNIRVINLSLGGPVWESYTLDPLCQAVEQAWESGIVVVVAAGNYGRDDALGTYGYLTITSPGNDPYVITVGAMNTMGTPDRTDDVPASYSSKGPSIIDWVVKPDLVAPGNLIDSLYFSAETLNQEYPGHAIPQSLYVTDGSTIPSAYYYQMSGTSMAAPSDGRMRS